MINRSIGHHDPDAFVVAPAALKKMAFVRHLVTRHLPESAVAS